MTAPPNPTEPPVSGRGCLWIALASAVLWILIAFAIRKGMT